jgi:hypothetical protein
MEEMCAWNQPPRGFAFLQLLTPDNLKSNLRLGKIEEK